MAREIVTKSGWVVFTQDASYVFDLSKQTFYSSEEEAVEQAKLRILNWSLMCPPPVYIVRYTTVIFESYT